MTDKNDPLYKEAVSIVLKEKNTAVSFLQRKLRVGYNRASSLLQSMESDGYLSKPGNGGRRDIVSNKPKKKTKSKKSADDTKSKKLAALKNKKTGTKKDVSRETKKEKRPVGRPTDFTKELGYKFCSLMVEGLSVRKICERDDMPAKTTIFRWISENEEFRDQYEIAYKMSVHSDADELMHVVKEMPLVPLIVRNRPVKDKNGDIVHYVTSQSVAHARLVADTLKWGMAKKMPKKYGDRITVDGADEFKNKSSDELREIIRQYQSS